MRISRDSGQWLNPSFFGIYVIWGVPPLSPSGSLFPEPLLYVLTNMGHTLQQDYADAIDKRRIFTYDFNTY